jgi:hypothetical protein
MNFTHMYYLKGTNRFSFQWFAFQEVLDLFVRYSFDEVGSKLTLGLSIVRNFMLRNQKHLNRFSSVHLHPRYDQTE